MLINGECLKEMENIRSGSIDMILTDPPYGTTKCSWDSVIPIDKMWIQLNRIIKDNGAIVLCGTHPFASRLICANLKYFRYEWIWEKPIANGFFNANLTPLRAHECLLVFYKKTPTYNPQKTFGHERKKSNRLFSGSEIYGKSFKKSAYDSTERYPRSVQLFGADKEKRLHPTQKPVELMKYFIETYTNENDVVLDFTMGSGSTGVACKFLDRQFIGIESNETYFNIAVDRIEKSQIGLSSFI